MKSPQVKTIKRLFAQSNNQCAFPGCITPMVNKQGVVHGEICHITAKNPDGPRFDSSQNEVQKNSYRNLILLCANHHKMIDNQPEVYDVEALQKLKKIHENKSEHVEKEEDEFYSKLLLNKYLNINHNSGTIIIDSPGAVKAENLTLKTQKKQVKLQPPENTIASDLKYRGYIKYLIDKYNKYAGDDKTRKYEFHYHTIYRSIKKEFGVTWEYVPKDNFERFVLFLQKKIDKTTIARINKGKGNRSYRSFKEYCQDKLKTK